MNITSAVFVKGLVGPDEILENNVPQVAFIGRSNVGKSSLINSLLQKKDLARTSSFPGHTQEINIFAITAGGKSFYFVDLPGYGFAKASKDMQEQLQQLIYWYLLGSEVRQKKVVLIVDANVGPTDNDEKMLYSLREQEKDVVVVANKVDKLKKSDHKKKIQDIQEWAGNCTVIPYSSEKKIGREQLLGEILK